MKFVNYLIGAAVCGFMLMGCGTPKSTTMSNPDKEIEITNPIMELADGNPNRAWGEATNGRLSYAKQYAEGQARAALARGIQTAIKTASKECDFDWTKASYTGQEGASVSDQGAKAEGLTQAITSMVLNNVVVIKTSVKQRPNGLYHVFVAVEQQDAPAKMANKVVEQVKQRVSDEDRLKMQFQFQKFEEAIDKELQKQKDDMYKQ